MTLLPETLDRVADEIDALADLGQAVQTVIARFTQGLTDAGPMATALLVDAQAADELCQRLEGLGRFVRALAESTPATAVDARGALAALTLGAQARRLSGAPAPSPAPEDRLILWD